MFNFWCILTNLPCTSLIIIIIQFNSLRGAAVQRSYGKLLEQHLPQPAGMSTGRTYLDTDKNVLWQCLSSNGITLRHWHYRRLVCIPTKHLRQSFQLQNIGHIFYDNVYIGHVISLAASVNWLCNRRLSQGKGAWWAVSGMANITQVYYLSPEWRLNFVAK